MSTAEEECFTSSSTGVSSSSSTASTEGKGLKPFNFIPYHLPLTSSGSWLTMHNCEIYYLSADYYRYNFHQGQYLPRARRWELTAKIFWPIYFIRVTIYPAALPYHIIAESLLKKQYKSVLYHWTTETTKASVSRSRIWRENPSWGKIWEKLFRNNDRQSNLDLYIIKKWCLNLTQENRYPQN